jgi:diguanylate cyclase (GGDEF)-like protein
VLADAVAAISSGAPIETAIEHVVAGLGVSPVGGVGCLLRLDHGDLVAFTDWPLGGSCPVMGDPTHPWQLAQRTGLPIDVDVLDGLDGRLASSMAERGYRSVWCRPVVNRRGEVDAVLVVFRTSATSPSSNQARRLDDIAAVAALAFDQLEDRSALERAAFTDPLTGAASRARLQREIESGIHDASVLYLDLDGFKSVNDLHGHEAGDDVLAEVAARLFDIVREDDLVVRVGGDEFVVVARRATRDDAAGIAARIVAELAVPYRITLRAGGEVEVVIGVSVGVCVQRRPMSFHDALRAADDALGAAKQAGKGRFHVAVS